MGLQAEIYTANRQDCSNFGISYYFHHVCIMNIDGPDCPREGVVPVMLKRHPVVQDIAIIVPCDREKALDGIYEAMTGTMMGGAFVATSDGRFRNAIKQLIGVKAWHGAVALHDRREW